MDQDVSLELELVSIAQGINLATNKPLYGVNALEVQAYLSLLCTNSKKKCQSKNAQGFYTQLFDFNLLPLSGPTAAREPGSKCHATSNNCIAYMILQFKC